MAVAPRANWKGYLKVGELSCPVALYTAASTSDRVSFHIINRETGHRVQREMVDADTGKAVESDDIIKGYEVSSGQYVLIEPDEIKAAVPEADKTLELESFIACNGVDTIYLDRPYFLAPTDKASADVFDLIRKGLEEKNVAALARTVLFRRMRTLLIRPSEEGLIASTLNYDYEVRPAKEIFSEIKTIKIEGEMLDLAKHIIGTKKGTFDPTKFDDRYEAALEELIKAKIEGRKVKKKPAPEPQKVTSLLDALRQSAGGSASPGKTPAKKSSTKKTTAKKSASKTSGKSAAAKKTVSRKTAPQRKAS
ncbi:non-homologous end joining protein Ku [Neorhizobium sp. SOG26]|uniref:non-homologous end joining protein Ku n=1 Tax=Neorhizobium sp. SOG26 TaxID=2060726 RepID=UPI0018FF36DE|nr:Ku protein [Neorhizobium sp. SOG26]